MLKRYVSFKIFSADFFRVVFAGMLNSCMSACAVWLHAFSCRFSFLQRAFSCMPCPSSLARAVRSAPVSAPSRLPCPFSPASPCAVPSALRRAASASLARVRQRQPSAVCASVPAVRQPSAHQAALVMPAVRLRQIKATPVNGMAGPPMHRGSASYGLTGRQLRGVATPSRTNAVRRFQAKSREFFRS